MPVTIDQAFIDKTKREADRVLISDLRVILIQIKDAIAENRLCVTAQEADDFKWHIHNVWVRRRHADKERD
jgi:hypothetical protein